MMPSQTASPQYIPLGFAPKNSDILCGRGKTNAKHPGNIVFMTVIKSSLNRYTNAGSRIAKSVVVTSVVDDIMAAGMRFLKVDPTCNQYMVLSSERVHEKVGHAIRDILKQHKKNTTGNNKSKGARRAVTKKIFPDMAHSIDQESKVGRKRPLSSFGVHQQQQMSLPETTCSMATMFGDIANEKNNTGELESVLFSLGENVCSKSIDDEEDLLAILTNEVFTTDCTVDAAALSCPLPLDSELDLDCLDIDAFSSFFSASDQ